MLVLSRKIGESIIIADEIKMTILSVDGRKVRLGIDAPDDVVVHREEVYQKIKAESEERETVSPASQYHG